MKRSAPRLGSGNLSEHPSPGNILSAAEFWQLMERWGIRDPEALELLQFAGKIGKSGKRPRFRFSPLQKRLTSYLKEIDAALASAGEDPQWLARKQRSAPFNGRSPLAHMVQSGEGGMAVVLRTLTVVAMRAALKR